ncbi:MAG: DUF120 domain-containing protein [Bacillota bacterium]
MSIYRQKSTVINGTVCSGVQQAGLFTGLNWVKEQCMQLVGFAPYPGTLNIRVDGKEFLQWQKWRRETQGLLLTPPNADYRAGMLFPGQLAEIMAAAVLPLVPGYPEDVIELIAPVHLRSGLNLEDGDQVAVLLVLKVKLAQKTRSFAFNSLLNNPQK